MQCVIHGQYTWLYSFGIRVGSNIAVSCVIVTHPLRQATRIFSSCRLLLRIAFFTWRTWRSLAAGRLLSANIVWLHMHLPVPAHSRRSFEQLVTQESTYSPHKELEMQDTWTLSSATRIPYSHQAVLGEDNKACVSLVSPSFPSHLVFSHARTTCIPSASSETGLELLDIPDWVVRPLHRNGCARLHLSILVITGYPK